MEFYMEFNNAGQTCSALSTCVFSNYNGFLFSASCKLATVFINKMDDIINVIVNL